MCSRCFDLVNHLICRVYYVYYVYQRGVPTLPWLGNAKSFMLLPDLLPTPLLEPNNVISPSVITPTHLHRPTHTYFFIIYDFHVLFIYVHCICIYVCMYICLFVCMCDVSCKSSPPASISSTILCNVIFFFFFFFFYLLLFALGRYPLNVYKKNLAAALYNTDSFP